MPTNIPKASFTNSVRLTDLVKDGKIYLSLSDAIALAIENNYDIAIARYDLDIADTDILRTRSGASPLGAPSALVTGTLGGSTSTLSTGGGPGGTTVGSGGAGSGVNGLTLTTAGAGPIPGESRSGGHWDDSIRPEPVAADEPFQSRVLQQHRRHITSPTTRALFRERRWRSRGTTAARTRAARWPAIRRSLIRRSRPR